MKTTVVSLQSYILSVYLVHSFNSRNVFLVSKIAIVIILFFKKRTKKYYCSSILRQLLKLSRMKIYTGFPSYTSFGKKWSLGRRPELRIRIRLGPIFFFKELIPNPILVSRIVAGSGQSQPEFAVLPKSYRIQNTIRILTLQ